MHDKNKNTCLHYACMSGSTISALALINYGANIDSINIFGNTPFDEALLNNQSDLCIFLAQNNYAADHKVNTLK